jgi:hypothetical protein
VPAEAFLPLGAAGAFCSGLLETADPAIQAKMPAENNRVAFIKLSPPTIDAFEFTLHEEEMPFKQDGVQAHIGPEVLPHGFMATGTATAIDAVCVRRALTLPATSLVRGHPAVIRLDATSSVA